MLGTMGCVHLYRGGSTEVGVLISFSPLRVLLDVYLCVVHI